MFIEFGAGAGVGAFMMGWFMTGTGAAAGAAMILMGPVGDAVASFCVTGTAAFRSAANTSNGLSLIVNAASGSVSGSAGSDVG